MGTFSDWTLTWGQSKSYKVHRIILASGTRRAEFFVGATNASFHASSTDLSLILPEACEAIVEKALDFMYGSPLEATVNELPLLHKFAEILQCPALQNSALDKMEEHTRQTDGARALIDQALATDNMDLVLALVLSAPPEVVWEVAPMIAKASPTAATLLIQHMVMDRQSYRCNLYKLGEDGHEWIEQGTGKIHVVMHPGQTQDERRLVMWAEGEPQQVLLDAPVIHPGAYAAQGRPATIICWEDSDLQDWALSFADSGQCKTLYKMLTRGRVST